jgi:hypothetical protein
LLPGASRKKLSIFYSKVFLIARNVSPRSPPPSVTYYLNDPLSQGWPTIFVRGPHCPYFLGASRARFQSKKAIIKVKFCSSRAGRGPRAVCCPLLPTLVECLSETMSGYVELPLQIQYNNQNIFSQILTKN